MLSKLSNIPGFSDYQKFISHRQPHNEHWKAEIKAIYELNKLGHPLTEITSQREFYPEAIFNYKKQPHLLECAYIERDVVPQLRQQYIDKLTKTFGNLSSLLIESYANYSILILIDGALPVQKELNKIRNQISVQLHKDVLSFAINGNWGRISVAQKIRNQPFTTKAKLFSILITSEQMEVIVDPGALQKKVMTVIANKQKQFRQKFSSYGKIYYIYIEATTDEIAALDFARIGGKLKKNELVLITTTFIARNEKDQAVDSEAKVMVSHGFDARGIDLFNKFFSQVLVKANIASELTKRKRIVVMEDFEPSRRKSIMRF
jgi:hypothetical protein